MNKIVILGDTHFGVRNGNDIFHYHNEDFFKNTFFPEIKKRGIKKIIHLGDVFDKRKTIDMSCLNKSKQYFFDKLVENNLEMIVCIGNHDCYYKNTNRINSPSELLTQYKNIQIISETEHKDILGQNVLFVPWINEENEENTFKEIKKSKSKIAFGHLEIKGYQMYKGLVSTSGHSKTMFKNFDKVFTGHFHHKNIKDNIYYLGTPVQYTWADAPDIRGFHIFDMKTQELEFIQNPNKVFHLLKPLDNDNKTLKLYNSFVKIIVGNDDHAKNVDEYIKLLEELGVYSIQVIDNRDNEIEIENIEISEETDNIDIVKKYIKTMENDYPQLNEILHDLYKRALEC